MKVALITANLGGIDKPVNHANQLVHPDYHTLTDENFPPRKGLTPRLQAKLPKMFGWQLLPGYDIYIWLDSSIRLAHHESIQYFIDAVEHHDIAVMKHAKRDTTHWEYRYTWRGLNSPKTSNYITDRYTGDDIDGLYELIQDDLNYTDDLMVQGGVIVYRNTPAVQAMFKDWFYYVCRYATNDQISLPYVLKTSGVNYNLLPDNFQDCRWLENVGHA